MLGLKKIDKNFLKSELKNILIGMIEG